ncbi:unnamed protein product [Rhizoctonia solani]|uniref:Uncharacterized protein n=3 Tax=Rhizoctonia solani TaxID=456999 RepID=A0A8H3HRD4_9AGAM|nr:unnamed protein product [Rhizoctonia solani]
MDLSASHVVLRDSWTRPTCPTRPRCTMSSTETNVPTPNPTDSRPPELQRGAFTRVNTYIPEDLATKLRNVPARIRKSVTEGYKTWEGEPIAPNVSHTRRDPRAQLGHGPLRPSIFQSSNNEGFRRVMTTPNPLPSNPGYAGIPRFADFGEPPARPMPANGGVRARVASLGNYPPSLPATSRKGSDSSKHIGAFDDDSDSDSDVNDAKSAAGSDAFGELFEAGEEKGSGASSMFGSRPTASPAVGEAPRQPRSFQQTQSLPAGSLSSSGIGTGQGVSTLDSLDEDEPWRQHDFSRYASIPPE